MKPVRNCRACGERTKEWLDLGSIYPSTFTDSPGPPPGMEKQPLNMVRCPACELVQLDCTIDRNSMYRQYWYESALNQSMVESLRDIVEGAKQRVEIKSGDSVLDIGCNDGTLLSMFGFEVNKIGFDPALNLAEKARKNCNVFVNDYFPSNDVTPTPCKLITSIAMFYDLDDPATFVEAVKRWLAPDGVWIIQMTDLDSVIRKNAWDSFVHEHLECWSLATLRLLLDQLHIDVFDVEYNMVNGGSLRAYCCHRGARKISSCVGNRTVECVAMEQYSKDVIGNNMRIIVSATRAFMLAAKTIGCKVAALGASTKGNTFLQVAGIGSDMVDAIGEVNPAKFGKYTVGSWIPIRPEAEVLSSDAEFLLVLPWHFIDGIKERCAAFLKRGGALIVPMPEPRVITATKEIVLW